MRIKVGDIITKYEAISQLINQHGFCNALLNNSFFPEVEKRFLLVVSDKNKDTRGTDYELGEALRGLLQCEVLVCRDTSVLPMHYKYWNDSNRVFLKSKPSDEDKKELTKALKRIFGDKWVFEPLREPERYAKQKIREGSRVSIPQKL